MTPARMRDAAKILGELGNGKMANELEELADRCTWKPISQIHEDYGTCVLIDIDDPGYMDLGSNLNADFDDTEWTHFVPIPSLTHEEAERLRADSVDRENSLNPREMVAQLMIARSIPTGHGDTIEALLGEFGSYIDECSKALREAIKKAGITT